MFNECVEIAREHKQIFVQVTERGDLPPVVVASRENKIICIVIAPQVDRDLGLKAAYLCRAGMGADKIFCCFDAHTNNGSIKDLEEFIRRYPPGSMQKKCDEEGACASGEISDCLVCRMVDMQGLITGKSILYDYHGKNGGVEFKWTRETDQFEDKLEDRKAMGIIPENLRGFMKMQPHFLRENWKKLAEGMTIDEQHMHATRGSIAALISQGFVVFSTDEKYIPEDMTGISYLEE